MNVQTYAERIPHYQTRLAVIGNDAEAMLYGTQMTQQKAEFDALALVPLDKAPVTRSNEFAIGLRHFS